MALITAGFVRRYIFICLKIMSFCRFAPPNHFWRKREKTEKKEKRMPLFLGVCDWKTRFLTKKYYPIREMKKQLEFELLSEIIVEVIKGWRLFCQNPEGLNLTEWVNTLSLHSFFIFDTRSVNVSQPRNLIEVRTFSESKREFNLLMES